MLKRYNNKNRVGDHIWYISSNSKFRKDYKEWNVQYSLKKIINDIIIEIKSRMAEQPKAERGYGLASLFKVKV
jgi:CDP-paratose 2-epimerase